MSAVPSSAAAVMTVRDVGRARTAANSAPDHGPDTEDRHERAGEPRAAVERVAREQREERREVVDERADHRDQQIVALISVMLHAYARPSRMRGRS